MVLQLLMTRLLELVLLDEMHVSSFPQQKKVISLQGEPRQKYKNDIVDVANDETCQNKVQVWKKSVVGLCYVPSKQVEDITESSHQRYHSQCSQTYKGLFVNVLGYKDAGSQPKGDNAEGYWYCGICDDRGLVGRRSEIEDTNA